MKQTKTAVVEIDLEKWSQLKQQLVDLRNQARENGEHALRVKADRALELMQHD